MNTRIVLALSTLFILMLAGGCRNIAVPTDTAHIEEWLAESPDSCLSYFTGEYTSLCRQKKYNEMEQLYARILRAIPVHPKESKGLNYLTGKVISYYYDALMRQDKQENSHWLTDSLLNSSHLYYAQTMRPELLVASADFYLSQSLIERADSLGRLFLSLPPTDDARRDARNCYRMAWALEFGNIDTDTLLHLAERAVEYCRKADGKVDRKGEIYSYMGYLYWREGALEKATHYVQDAIDWYAVHPEASGEGLIETYSNLSRLYVSLRLFDKAIEANARALQLSKSLDNCTLKEVYRMRAACFEKAANQDSALYYVQKAIEATPASVAADYLPNLYIDRMGYYYSAHPDSIAYRLEECRHLLKDTANVGFERKNNLLIYYGMALRQTPGREREAVPYLEQSYRNFLAYDYPEGVLLAGDELMRTYIKAGMTDRIPKIYITYIDTADSLQHEDNANAAIGVNIRYETGRKEQENRALAAEVSLKQRTLSFTWILVGLLLALLVVGTLYVRQRQRYHRRVSDARLSQISGLLRTQQELQESNEALSAQLDSASKRKAVSDIRVKISTELFNSDKEAEFRRSFTAVYPDYLLALHKLSPDMTRTDELIAMLLLLDLSNQEIALTLGISKNGVNKARSRMRQRLGLSSEMVLEDFLKGILE